MSDQPKPSVRDQIIEDLLEAYLTSTTEYVFGKERVRCRPEVLLSLATGEPGRCLFWATDLGDVLLISDDSIAGDYELLPLDPEWDKFPTLRRMEVQP